MELSIRLEALFDMVEPHLILADIGTDHAFLPIELVSRGKCGKVIACDVGEGPIERARQHIRESRMEQQIETRLADGLKGLEPGEAQAVVLAGMGGALMASILENAPAGVLEGLDQLLLQPQSEMDKVRRKLKEIGFVPVKEKMTKDRDKFYWIISAKRCPASEKDKPEASRGEAEKEKRSWNDLYGSLLPGSGDPVFEEFLQKKCLALRKLMAELEGKEGKASRNRLEEVEAEYRMLRELLTM